MQYPHKHKVVAIVGPTAVGKTDLSIQIAEQIGGEIISADSRLFYRGMNIGTAKPSEREMQSVPHHLIDIAEINEDMSLAKFKNKATDLIAEINQRNKTPILVGGTGQYIFAVLEGWTIPPKAPDIEMRKVLNAWCDHIGPERLHKKLTLIDPVAAQKIDYRNIRRTIRALEVIFTTGNLFSIQRAKEPVEFVYKIVGLQRERKELYARIDERIDGMFRKGLIDEVKNILEGGYDPGLSSLSAIGYTEVISYLQGKMSLEEAIILIKRKTRTFVRRQSNWFKKDDPRIAWFNMKEPELKQITGFIQEPKGWINDDQ